MADQTRTRAKTRAATPATNPPPRKKQRKVFSDSEEEVQRAVVIPVLSTVNRRKRNVRPSGVKQKRTRLSIPIPEPVPAKPISPYTSAIDTTLNIPLLPKFQLQSFAAINKLSPTSRIDHSLLLRKVEDITKLIVSLFKDRNEESVGKKSISENYQLLTQDIELLVTHLYCAEGLDRTSHDFSQFFVLLRQLEKDEKQLVCYTLVSVYNRVIGMQPRALLERGSPITKQLVCGILVTAYGDADQGLFDRIFNLFQEILVNQLTSKRPETLSHRINQHYEGEYEELKKICASHGVPFDKLRIQQANGPGKGAMINFMAHYPPSGEYQDRARRIPRSDFLSDGNYTIRQFKKTVKDPRLMNWTDVVNVYCKVPTRGSDVLKKEFIDTQTGKPFDKEVRKVTDSYGTKIFQAATGLVITFGSRAGDLYLESAPLSKNGEVGADGKKNSQLVVPIAVEGLAFEDELGRSTHIDSKFEELVVNVQDVKNEDGELESNQIQISFVHPSRPIMSGVSTLGKASLADSALVLATTFDTGRAPAALNSRAISEKMTGVGIHSEMTDMEVLIAIRKQIAAFKKEGTPIPPLEQCEPEMINYLKGQGYTLEFDKQLELYGEIKFHSVQQLSTSRASSRARATQYANYANDHESKSLREAGSNIGFAASETAIKNEMSRNGGDRERARKKLGQNKVDGQKAAAERRGESVETARKRASKKRTATMNANYHAAGKTIAAGRKQSTLLGNATKNANWIAAGKDPAQERSKRGRNANAIRGANPLLAETTARSNCWIGESFPTLAPTQFLHTLYKNLNKTIERVPLFPLVLNERISELGGKIEGSLLPKGGQYKASDPMTYFDFLAKPTHSIQLSSKMTGFGFIPHPALSLSSKVAIGESKFIGTGIRGRRGLGFTQNTSKKDDGYFNARRESADALEIGAAFELLAEPDIMAVFATSMGINEIIATVWRRRRRDANNNPQRDFEQESRDEVTRLEGDLDKAVEATIRAHAKKYQWKINEGCVEEAGI